MRYTYAYGYRTSEAAHAALDDLMNEGEVSQGERPKIKAYPEWTTSNDRVTRYQITLED